MNKTRFVSTTQPSGCVLLLTVADEKFQIENAPNG